MLSVFVLAVAVATTADVEGAEVGSPQMTVQRSPILDVLAAFPPTEEACRGQRTVHGLYMIDQGSHITHEDVAVAASQRRHMRVWRWT
jgi:hypothetical protein